MKTEKQMPKSLLYAERTATPMQQTAMALPTNNMRTITDFLSEFPTINTERFTIYGHDIETRQTPESKKKGVWCREATTPCYK